MKPYHEQSLSNGLTLILIPDQSLPRVSLGLLVKAGSINDTPGKWGLASFTGAMLENGTRHRSAMKLADDLGQIASDLEIGVSHDASVFSASTISTENSQLLELFSDVILHPVFEQKEINRERIQVLSAIEKRQDEPSHFADILMAQILFDGHPYAHPSGGEKESIKTLKRQDLINFYKKYYSPKNSILYVSGAYDQNFLENVKRIFSEWTGDEVRGWTSQSYSVSPATSMKLFSKPDLKQAQIRIAQRGIRRIDPDYLPLKIANMILGGDFVSRLNFRVRDQLGLTYSIHSSLDARLDFGAFDISTFSRNEKLGETIMESKKVLQQFVDQGVTASELEAAKALMVGQFPAAIETTDKLASNLIMARLYGIGDDYLKNYITNLNAVTLDQVNAAIKKHFQPENFEVVVYADKSKVLDQMKAIGKVDIAEIRGRK